MNKVLSVNDSNSIPAEPHQHLDPKKAWDKSNSLGMPPLQGKGRLFEVAYEHGVFIRATPAGDARNIGVLDYGDEVILTDKERPSRDEPGVTYIKVLNSGWVRKSKNGHAVFILK